MEWTKEQRLAQSERLKGRKLTEAHRLSISTSMKGKVKSEEHRRNLSVSTTAAHKTGKIPKHSDETKDIIRVFSKQHYREGKLTGLSFTGHTHTDVTKQKMGERIKQQQQAGTYVASMQGKNHSEEAKQKMRNRIQQRKEAGTFVASRKDAHNSEESKQKMRQHWLDGKMAGAYSWGRHGKRIDLNNQFFRSTWEANYARILNLCAIKWQYESKRFETPYGTYCPDFYLPAIDYYIEVKGFESVDSLQLRKRAWLVENDILKLIMIDGDKYGGLRAFYATRISAWED